MSPLNSLYWPYVGYWIRIDHLSCSRAPSLESPRSRLSSDGQHRGGNNSNDSPPAARIYCVTVEECILRGYSEKSVSCLRHGELPLCLIAPDTVSSTPFILVLTTSTHLLMSSNFFFSLEGFHGPRWQVPRPPGRAQAGQAAWPRCFRFRFCLHLQLPDAKLRSVSRSWIEHFWRFWLPRQQQWANWYEKADDQVHGRGVEDARAGWPWAQLSSVRSVCVQGCREQVDTGSIAVLMQGDHQQSALFILL